MVDVFSSLYRNTTGGLGFPIFPSRRRSMAFKKGGEGKRLPSPVMARPGVMTPGRLPW